TSGGFTSIYLGMKWGVVMLDPAFRPDIQRAGLPADLANRTERPFAWRRANTMKIIVLMTDGEHQANHALRPDYRSGTAGSSIIWRNGTTSEYSMFVEARTASTNAQSVRCNPYWVPHKGNWQARAWQGGSDYIWTSSSSGPACGTITSDTTATRQSWQQVWASLRINWVAYQLYARGNCLSGLTGMSNDQTCRNREYQIALRAIRDPSDGANALDDTGEIGLPAFYGPMDTKLLDTCHQAHQQGIIIYGIGFEVARNQRGEQAIQNCVSDRGRVALTNYFYAEGLQIDRVFRTIAAQINALKLVQ
ncbi:MAG TPA: hypothetical protein VM899_05805, partial [Rubellimicrobium sp.]|nr:hypothetical protein [Rubellimicrobium sp.]